MTIAEQPQQGAPKEQPKPEDLAAPKAGSWLNQNWTSWIGGEVFKLLGEFQPKYVGIDTYMLMQLDPTVAFGTAILRAPIINMPYKVTGRDSKIVAAVDQMLKPKYRQLATCLSNSMKWGWQVAEEVLVARPFMVDMQEKPTEPVTETKLPMAWLFDEFKSIDPRTLQLAVNPATDKFWGVWQNSFGLVDVKTPPPVPASRVALWSFRQDDAWGKLHGFPVYDQCYSPWYAKIAMELFANRYFERRADPTLVAYGDADKLLDEHGQEIDGIAYLLRIMQAIKTGSNAVLPAGFDEKGNRKYQLQYLMDDKRGDMFQQRIMALDTAILRGMWITDRAGTTHGSAGGGLGTGGEAQVHQETLGQTLEAIQREWVDQVVNPQVVDRLVLYNFGPQALEEAQVRVVPTGLSGPQSDVLKEVLFKLIDSENLQGSGSALPIYKHFDVPGITKALDVPLVDPEELKQLLAQHAEDQKAMQEQMAQGAAGPAGGPDGGAPAKVKPEPKPAASAAGKKAALDFLKNAGVIK